jgi:transposase
MRRAVKVSTQWLTKHKSNQLKVLYFHYKHAVNFYIKSIWEIKGGLNAQTLSRLQNTKLTERQKSQALKQALEIVTSTKKSAKALHKMASMPYFDGCATLDAKLVSVERVREAKRFNIAIRISSLIPGKKVTVLTKMTPVANKWLNEPDAKFVDGCNLLEDQIILWIDLPDPGIRRDGKIGGIDLGIKKMIASSDHQFFGKEFEKILDKIGRRKRGSKGREKTYEERLNYINRVLNLFPWHLYSILGHEDLKGMKKGKKFNWKTISWAYRQILSRGSSKAQENRVLLAPVSPANTSRRCPKCSKVSKKNRRGENFRCIFCGYAGDADFIGAKNVFDSTLRFLGSCGYDSSTMPISSAIESLLASKRHI